MSLPHHEVLIGLYAHQRLHRAAGPMDLQRIYLRVVAQAKGQAHVVGAHVAVAAADFPRLH